MSIRRFVAGLSRHPSPLELGAFFDGEGGDSVAAHLPGCQRCQGRLHEARRVRAAVRGEPVPPPALGASRVPGFLVGAKRPLLAPLALGVVMILAALTIGPARAPFRGVTRTILGQRPGEEEPRSPTGGGDVAARKRTASPSRGPQRQADHKPAVALPPAPTLVPAPVPGPVPGSPPLPGPGPSSTTSVVLPFRLGLVVPRTGPSAPEGRDVIRAVQQVAAATSTKGGVKGRPVEVVVAFSEDSADVASLPTRVDVMVGGFGLPPTPKQLWLLPAEPDVTGPGVVAADPTSRAAGARLARDLLDRHVEGQVAIVVGQGPEATFADGVTDVVRTTSEAAKPGSSCEKEVGDLHKLDPPPAALAVAGPPELASKCVEAAQRLGWHPPGGVLLAPSAAYAHLDALEAAKGARTVLGERWPTAEGAGSARFRAAVPGSASYRALVSFSAAELAVQVANANGGRPITLADVIAGTWKTDLLDFQGTANRGVAVVVLGPKGWATPS